MAVPMLNQDASLLGVCILLNKHGGEAFTRSDQRLLELHAEQVMSPPPPPKSKSRSSTRPVNSPDAWGCLRSESCLWLPSEAAQSAAQSGVVCTLSCLWLPEPSP